MKRYGICFALVLTAALTSCGSDDAPVSESEIYEVRQIGRLSTTEYTVGKIIRLDDKGEWYKWGERKILMSCKARIKAGVDLGSIRDEDITVRGKRIEIQLPPPEIISFEMNPDEVKTEMQDISGLRADFSQSEKNRIMRLGEKSIRKDLQKLHILRDAETNAIAFLTDFYKELGFEEIIIHGTEKTQRD